MSDYNQTSKRKTEHIEIVMNEQVNALYKTTGFENYQFKHLALPEIDFSSIDLSTAIFDKKVDTPFLISSMTGGTEDAWQINQKLATVAQARGWAMSTGSVRSAIENPQTAYTFNIRKYAPDIPIIANLGAVQFNYGYGVDECKKAVEITEADALVMHLNTLQEVFQPEGDTNFNGLLSKISKVCSELNVPVGIKEVGWGIDGDLANQLYEKGVSFIDVAGAGGTSWSEVEKHRNITNSIKQRAADTFREWGIPTSRCIQEIHSVAPKCILIGSGGMRNGLDAAKAFALGADLVGFGGSILSSAVESEEHLSERLEQIELECKIAMFGIGVKTIQELQNTDRLEYDKR
ncbi:type 2 isopentenyl-diphosphate Delta-isomerase [Pseudalkalibacillus berkeleyi]|uniref:Isopentenyl-diphosphate delta-isomerase n=1 Tax=Pseudalkalibacillus berkeleyi TaxID=1069813 RepID=A0ABS9H3B1_9BACL|nr:type 2 isopentenyl-diphosphate Delta-isomerase [Pseudalkalibacillus berkeleyi]MCF6138426.1 type 2 isopentenyl-diphosphate Delta-isomerase [Pseudalkalibacillus berkeleyi]